jgi:signal transduction histidine kinase
VRVNLSGENVAIEVKNQGPGISAEELPHLFERFWRAEGAKKSTVSGTGLGLYIAHGLIEAHGGRIWAESIPGETTSFHLNLPIFSPANTAGSQGSG